MDKPQFMYVVYISSTPEAVWNALIDPEMTRRYWVNHRNASDWKEGSRWTMEDYDDPSVIDVAGRIVESDPPRRLVLTWAPPEDEGIEARHSRVTFVIEAVEEQTRVTLTHDNLDDEALRSISSGWPWVLSSLKSLLETGTPLRGTSRRRTSSPA